MYQFAQWIISAFGSSNPLITDNELFIYMTRGSNYTHGVIESAAGVTVLKYCFMLINYN